MYSEFGLCVLNLLVKTEWYANFHWKAILVDWRDFAVYKVNDRSNVFLVQLKARFCWRVYKLSHLTLSRTQTRVCGCKRTYISACSKHHCQCDFNVDTQVACHQNIVKCVFKYCCCCYYACHLSLRYTIHLIFSCLSIEWLRALTTNIFDRVCTWIHVVCAYPWLWPLCPHSFNSCKKK